MLQAQGLVVIRNKFDNRYATTSSIKTLDLVVSDKIYHIFHYIQQHLENTNLSFLKYSLIRNNFDVRWLNKKICPKVKFKIFQNMVMLHIKLRRITRAATWYKIFCLKIPHPDPRDGIYRSRLHYFQNMAMLHIKFKKLTITATR